MERHIIHPEALLQAYASGSFPMAESADSEDVHLFTPYKRGILPLDLFHVSRNVQRLARNGGYSVWRNRAFSDVIRLCGETRPETWINPIIRDSYEMLHELGFAHSIEVYRGGHLVGGLYGVSLGAAFMGESMFRLEPEADKIALLHCYNLLICNNFKLWDSQYWTPHLAQFGCIEISQQEYRKLLRNALLHTVQLGREAVQIA